MDLARTDLTGISFRSIDLSGGNLAHSTLTGCRFSRCVGTNFVCAHGEQIDFRDADITGSTFERADESVLACLVGATWRGIEITHVSGWITRDPASVGYWCFATNAFVQCGCMQRTLAEWQVICRDEHTITVLHDEQPKIDLPLSLAWWRASSPAIVQTVQRFHTRD